MDLNSIEMAVVAEVDLEMAQAYEEVAGDPAQPPETRRAAREAASRWRERARICRLEARRRTAEPIVPTDPNPDAGRPYTGPERRRGERRRGDRRNGSAESERVAAFFGPDRRVNPDRRRGDRRRALPTAR